MELENEIIEELKIILSDLYFKYGRDEEVVRLSQILDKLIVKKQLNYLNNKNKNN